MTNRYAKIGSVELSLDEAQSACERGLYIVAFRRVYQIHHSAAQGQYYGRQVYYSTDACPLTRRGRYVALTGAEVNRLIGHELLA